MTAPARRILARRGRVLRRRRGVHAPGRRRIVQPHRGFARRIARLPQRRDIVQNPERAPVRGQHQVVAVNDQVVHRRRRQIQLQRFPVCARIVRNKNAGFRSGEQQAFALRIFPHGAHERAFRDALHQQFPGLAVIRGGVNIGPQIVVGVPVHRHPGGAGIERRGIDLADLAPFGHLLRRHVRPILAAIASDVHQPIVGARPDQALRQRRFGHREDGVVIFRAGIVDGDRVRRRVAACSCRCA